MFFILSKILFYIAMPLVWITSILIFALYTKNPSRRKKSILCALILVLIFGNEFIANEIFLLWEKDPVPIASLPAYEYGIVLTGVTNTSKESVPDRVYFAKGADRVLHTVQLYKLGKIKKIIVSGGSGKVINPGIQEAPQLKKVFIYCGVKENDIIIESNSRNTRENAIYTKKLTDSLHIKGKFLLITSAFHMRRAEGCFKKVNFNVDIFPVDIYTHDRTYTPNNLIIPQESALGKWAILIHEIIGFLAYKIMGYS